MNPGDLLVVLPRAHPLIPGEFANTHELFGNSETPEEYLEEEGYNVLITTLLTVHAGELCTLLRVGKPSGVLGDHNWVRILKGNGETGWITSRWLKKIV